MRIKPIVFSVGGAIIISLFFILSLFWIFYEYAGSLNSAKDAINTLGGYLGGIATLWAAIIAAYLFNDWREQQKYLNASKASDFLYRASDKYIASYEKYVDFMWSIRFNPEIIIESNKYFNEFLKHEKDLKIAIQSCKKSFNAIDSKLESNIDYLALEKHLDKIDLALKNLHPVSLTKENEQGYVDKKYVDENRNLMILYSEFDSIFLHQVRFQIDHFLLTKALNQSIP